MDPGGKPAASGAVSTMVNLFLWYDAQTTDNDDDNAKEKEKPQAQGKKSERRLIKALRYQCCDIALCGHTVNEL